MIEQPSFFFDHNVPAQIAEGLRAFGERVTWLEREYPNRLDIDDLEWMADCGRGGLDVVTRDLAYRRNKLALDHYRRHKVGGFWLHGKNRSACEMIQQVVRCWPNMKKAALDSTRPFIYIVPTTGTKLERFAL